MIIKNCNERSKRGPNSPQFESYSIIQSTDKAYQVSPLQSAFESKDSDMFKISACVPANANIIGEPMSRQKLFPHSKEQVEPVN